MQEDLSRISEAFSRKANLYDDFGRDHPNLERLRGKVRAHVQDLLPPGSSILELNAGTGADAAFFATQGYRVHATDVSPGMVAQIREKAERLRLWESLTIQACSFLDLDQIKGGPYDCIFSNMGGLNCSANLQPVAASLPALLIPGGLVIWVVMPPTCLWELGLLLKGRGKLALRRLARGGAPANVEGVVFNTYYYSPKQAIQAFPPSFRPLSLRGLSVFTPPADHKEFPFRQPEVYRLLRALDERFADLPPFNRLGDFYILTLRYIPPPAAR